MNPTLESILQTGETVKWQGKMSRKVLGFILTLSLVIVLMFSVFLFAAAPQAVAFACLVFIAMISTVILKFFMDYVVVFTITDKRIIIRSGIIGTDYNSIYFSQIRTTNVRVDLIDKIFSVGTIYIDTGKIETITGNNQSQTKTAYDKLSYIETPYEVYKILEEFKTK